MSFWVSPAPPKKPGVPFSERSELIGDVHQRTPLPSGDPLRQAPKWRGSPEGGKGGSLADVAGQLATFRQWDPWVFGVP